MANETLILNLMQNYNIILAIICSTLLILLLIAIVVIVIVVYGKRQAQTRMQYEQELRKAETEVKEQVMGEFAQELHDNIGQLLTAMHIQIENQKLDHPDWAEGLQPIEYYLGDVTRQLKLLSRTLNTDYVGQIGLLAALQTEVDRLNALKRFTVQFTAPQGNTNLDRNSELIVFRIFQEITQNALRHSGAAHLSVWIDHADGGFILRVQDDGKGFDLKQVMDSKRASGLMNILKRARLSGIRCDIVTEPGKGCLFTLKKTPPLS